MMKKLFWLSALTVFLMPTTALAAAGDNCETDITARVPDGTDWKGTFIVEGEDGSAWQRAFISQPKEEIIVDEDIPIVIQGSAGTQSEVNVFLFTPQDNGAGGLQAPGNGTCFETGTADENGLFSLTINSIFLWNRIDETLYIDAFYKLDENFDEITERQTGLTAGTYVPPKEYKINAVGHAGENLGLIPLPPPPPPIPGMSPGASGSVAPIPSESGFPTPTPSAGSGGIAPPPPPPPPPGGSTTPAPSGSDSSTSPPTTQPSPSSKPGTCESICGGRTVLAMRLDPASTTPEIAGNLFDPIGGMPVVIGRIPGEHTFYTGLENSDRNVDVKVFQQISLAAASMELIKRGLLGNENAGGVNPGLGGITAATLQDAANGNGNTSERTKNIAFYIKSIMVKDGAAANNINQLNLPPPPPPPPSGSTSPTPSASPSASAFPSESQSPSPSASATVNPSPSGSSAPDPSVSSSPSTSPIGSGQPSVPPLPPPPSPSTSASASPNPSDSPLPTPGDSSKPTLPREEAISKLKGELEYLKSVDLDAAFPRGVSEAEWATTFVQMLTFWTGGASINTCLIKDDSVAHKNFRASTRKGNQCGLDHSNGVSPLLLLHGEEAITLRPDFIDTRIVYADREFDSDESYAFASGKKEPLFYQYAFTDDFSTERAGSMCAQRKDLPLLLSSIEETYELSPAESTILAREIYNELPLMAETDFIEILFAKPQDVAQRIRWTGNGELLSLFQLFFELTPRACDTLALEPPHIEVTAERAGFEVGLLK